MNGTIYKLGVIGLYGLNEGMDEWEMKLYEDWFYLKED